MLGFSSTNFLLGWKPFLISTSQRVFRILLTSFLVSELINLTQQTFTASVSEKLTHICWLDIFMHQMFGFYLPSHGKNNYINEISVFVTYRRQQKNTNHIHMNCLNVRLCVSRSSVHGHIHLCVILGVTCTTLVSSSNFIFKMLTTSQITNVCHITINFRLPRSNWDVKNVRVP
jgi:hypothetical protein